MLPWQQPWQRQSNCAVALTTMSNAPGTGSVTSSFSETKLCRKRRSGVSMCPNCAELRSLENLRRSRSASNASAHYEPQRIRRRLQFFKPHSLRQTIHALRVEHDVVVVEI